MSPTTPPKADEKEIVNPSSERNDEETVGLAAQEARRSRSVDEPELRIGDYTNRVSFALPTPSTTGESSSIKETPMAVATIHAIELTASRSTIDTASTLSSTLNRRNTADYEPIEVASLAHDRKPSPKKVDYTNAPIERHPASTMPSLPRGGALHPALNIPDNFTESLSPSLLQPMPPLSATGDFTLDSFAYFNPVLSPYGGIANRNSPIFQSMANIQAGSFATFPSPSNMNFSYMDDIALEVTEEDQENLKPSSTEMMKIDPPKRAVGKSLERLTASMKKKKRRIQKSTNTENNSTNTAVANRRLPLRKRGIKHPISSVSPPIVTTSTPAPRSSIQISTARIRTNQNIQKSIGKKRVIHHYPSFGKTTIVNSIETKQSLTVATRGCKCPNSKCVKLYCECFQGGNLCGGKCRCDSCHNTLEESYPGGLRHSKIQECISKRADAFHVREVKSAEDEGCKCKKSHCLKKYCQCFKQGIKCSDLCSCSDCLNLSDEVEATEVSAEVEEVSDEDETVEVSYDDEVAYESGFTESKAYTPAAVAL